MPRRRRRRCVKSAEQQPPMQHGPDQLDKFAYSKLDPCKGEIRLVEILPGTFEDPLSVKIFHAPLSKKEKDLETRWSIEAIQSTMPSGWDALETLEGRVIFVHNGITFWEHPTESVDPRVYNGPPPADAEICSVSYEALSYVWGNDSAREVLFVHGTSSASAQNYLLIRPNLALALRHLRNMADSRVMWIDAISISQDDLSERNEQVTRMGEIFTLAHRVIAWIGPEDNTSQYALEKLDRFAKRFELTGTNRFLKPPGEQNDIFEWDNPNSIIKRIWLAVERLLRRPWFRRTWTLQEIQLASRHSVIKCGGDEILWTHFRRAMLFLTSKYYRLGGAWEADMSKGFTTCKPAQSSPVEELFSISRQRVCSDPKDFIYGILNLLPTKMRQHIPVDYSLSMMEISKHVFEAHYKLTRRYNLINEDRHEQANWPSWLADLRHMSRAHRWRVCAAGQSRAYISRVSEAKIDIAGYLVDTISSFEYLDATTLQDVVEFMRERCIRAKAYPTGKPRFDAYCHLLDMYIYHRVYRSRLNEELQDCFWELVSNKEGLDAMETRLTPDLESEISDFVSDLCSEVFFTTTKGYIGICTADTCLGDQVFIFLGCQVPLILRPLPAGEYRVIGSSEVEGAMHGEMLCGKLPEPWAFCKANRNGIYRTVCFSHKTNEETVLDPRLKDIPIPAKWEQIEFEPTREDPNNCCKFRNKYTDEVINWDPRMSMKAINERGLPNGGKIEMIRLI